MTPHLGYRHAILLLGFILLHPSHSATTTPYTQHDTFYRVYASRKVGQRMRRFPVYAHQDCTLAQLTTLLQGKRTLFTTMNKATRGPSFPLRVNDHRTLGSLLKNLKKKYQAPIKQMKKAVYVYTPDGEQEFAKLPKRAAPPPDKSPHVHQSVHTSSPPAHPTKAVIIPPNLPLLPDHGQTTTDDPHLTDAPHDPTPIPKQVDPTKTQQPNTSTHANAQGHTQVGAAQRLTPNTPLDHTLHGNNQDNLIPPAKPVTSNHPSSQSRSTQPRPSNPTPRPMPTSKAIHR